MVSARVVSSGPLIKSSLKVYEKSFKYGKGKIVFENVYKLDRRSEIFTSII